MSGTGICHATGLQEPTCCQPISRSGLYKFIFGLSSRLPNHWRVVENGNFVQVTVAFLRECMENSKKIQASRSNLQRRSGLALRIYYWLCSNNAFAKQKIKVHDQVGDGPLWGKSISRKFQVLHIKMFYISRCFTLLGWHHFAIHLSRYISPDSNRRDMNGNQEVHRIPTDFFLADHLGQSSLLATTN